MFMADLVQHRLLTDAELKGQVVREHPYRRWQMRTSLSTADLFPAEPDGAHAAACGDLPGHASGNAPGAIWTRCAI